MERRSCRQRLSFDDWLGLRLTILLAGALCIAFLTPGVAAAGQYESSTTSGVYVNGYTYHMYSWITTSPGKSASFGTHVTEAQGIGWPSGWVEIEARIFYSTGTLCRASTKHVFGVASGAGVEDSPACGAGPLYFSEGLTWFWNGSGYDEYHTLPTPNDTT